jgi:hypothetical protein
MDSAEALKAWIWPRAALGDHRMDGVGAMRPVQMELDPGRGERLRLILVPSREFMMGDTLNPNLPTKPLPQASLERILLSREPGRPGREQTHHRG